MSLGTAFENLSRGLGMAYFPAISLSFKESVAFNFGSRPLRYPFWGEGCGPLGSSWGRPPYPGASDWRRALAAMRTLEGPAKGVLREALEQPWWCGLQWTDEADEVAGHRGDASRAIQPPGPALPQSLGCSPGPPGRGLSELHIRRCWLNSVVPTQFRATGPSRTLRALTWREHRSCWAASRPYSAWSWMLW